MQKNRNVFGQRIFWNGDHLEKEKKKGHNLEFCKHS